MAFMPVEILALVLIVLVAIKLVFLFIKPPMWMKVVRFIYSSPFVLLTVELIAAGIALYFLLQELTIVQILAVILLGALLTGIGFAAYGKEVVSWAGKILKKGFLKKAWLPILVWLALIVWGALTLFELI